MDKRPINITKADHENQQKKIYVAMVGSAPMSSIDALMLSLERFKTMLSSDSAKDRFDTSIRSIQPTLAAVNAFIDAAYAQKNPAMAVTMKGRTLIVEVAMPADEFLACIADSDVDEILSHVVAVGTMQAQKPANQKMRDYAAYPVRYFRGQFIK